jgi:hypothetical protein
LKLTGASRIPPERGYWSIKILSLSKNATSLNINAEPERRLYAATLEVLRILYIDKE